MTTMRELERYQRRQRRIRILQAILTWIGVILFGIVWLLGAIVMLTWIMAWLLRP